MDTAMPLPKYHQIYLVLREQLQEGRYDVDGVPGEHALAAQFQVARITIRKAMEMLVGPGWCRAGPAWAPGRAAQPRPLPRRARARRRSQLTGLMENIVNMGLRTAVRVLDCVQVGAPAGGRGAGDRAGEPVIKSLRVRSTGRPCPTSPLTCRWPSQPSRARTWSASPC